MHAKLDQLLAYLERDEVEEIVIGIGLPLSIRTPSGYQSLTPAPLTRAQFDLLAEGTALADAQAARSGGAIKTELGARRVRIESTRHGDKLALRIRRATESPASIPAPAAPPPPASEPVDERGDVSSLAPYVRAARLKGATDLHVAAGQPVLVRCVGALGPLDRSAPPLTNVGADAVLLPLLTTKHRQRLAQLGYVDLAIDIDGAGRVRANISHHQGGVRGAFRLTRGTAGTLEELGLPRELAKIVHHHQGLVVIAGPSGHGKTTTMAALVDLINSTQPFHIITIEDPVEIEHPHKQSIVSQREVGRHTASFATALKASLREDPDVIVVGELRDRETVEIALAAAETGHLVLATISTPSAAKTLDRLIDMFPAEDQAQVRMSLAGSLRAIVAQKLLPLARGNGVVPAIELVTGVLPLAVLIRDDKLYQLPSLLQRGRAFGMIRLEESVQELSRMGKITDDVARQALDTKPLVGRTPTAPAVPRAGKERA
jgi:twitching motility protein PilT